MSDFCIAGEGADFRVVEDAYFGVVDGAAKMTNALTVDKLIDHLSRFSARGHGAAVAGLTYDPGVSTIGGSPFAAIVGVQPGFDWDNGRVFLQTEKLLGLADQELSALKKKMSKIQNVVFFAERQLKDKRLSNDEKINKTIEIIDYYKK